MDPTFSIYEDDGKKNSVKVSLEIFLGMKKIV